MNAKIGSLIIRNTIARYEPFTIKEVFHIKLNRVVQYAVFIDNDPFEQELGFDKIPFDNYPFEPKFELDNTNLEGNNSKDNYFLTKLTEIIKKRLKSQQCSLENSQNILKDILANPAEDPIMQEIYIESEKRYILDRTQRIEFIKASEKKLKASYKC